MSQSDTSECGVGVHLSSQLDKKIIKKREWKYSINKIIELVKGPQINNVQWTFININIFHSKLFIVFVPCLKAREQTITSILSEQFSNVKNYFI